MIVENTEKNQVYYFGHTKTELFVKMVTRGSKALTMGELRCSAEQALHLKTPPDQISAWNTTNLNRDECFVR